MADTPSIALPAARFFKVGSERGWYNIGAAGVDKIPAAFMKGDSAGDLVSVYLTEIPLGGDLDPLYSLTINLGADLHADVASDGSVTVAIAGHTVTADIDDGRITEGIYQMVGNIFTHDPMAAMYAAMDVNNGALSGSVSISDGDSSDTTPPTVVSRTANGDTMTLVCSEDLGNNLPVTSSFRVRVAGASGSVSKVAISGKTITLTFTPDAEFGDAVTVQYVKPSSNPIQDKAGNDLASFAAVAVTNDTPKPVPTLTVSIAGETSLNTGQQASYQATIGGTATGASSYQWQRRSGTSGSWANVGTSATYSQTQSSAGTWQVRLQLTREGVTVTSNVITTVWTVAPKPTTVTANAGSDQVVASGGKVSIGGTDTVNNPSGATAVKWTRVSGSGGSLSSTTVAEPEFTAPTLAPNAANRVITWRKTVTNNLVSDTDDVAITVTSPSTITTTEVDTIYIRGTTAPSKPTGGRNSATHLPSGWSRTNPGVSSTENLYESKRTITKTNGVFTRATAWGAVKKIGNASGAGGRWVFRQDITGPQGRQGNQGIPGIKGTDGDDGLPGADGIGIEYCFASSADGAAITGAANLPDPDWNFDIVSSTGTVRGNQKYYDGTPTDISSARQWMIRFRRPVPGSPAQGAEIGTVAWTQEPAIKVFAIDGSPAERRGAAIFNIHLTAAQLVAWRRENPQPGARISTVALVQALDAAVGGSPLNNDWVQITADVVDGVVFIPTWAVYNESATEWRRANRDFIAAGEIQAIDISAITGDFKDIKVTGTLAADHIDADVQNVKVLFKGSINLVFRTTNSAAMSDDIGNYDILQFYGYVQGGGGNRWHASTGIEISRVQVSENTLTSPNLNYINLATSDTDPFNAHARIWRGPPSRSNILYFYPIDTFIINAIVGIKQPG